MALPLLALGKIVSGAIGATAKGLTVAAKATGKGLTVAAKATGKAASATGKAVGKAAQSTTKGLKRIISKTSESLSTNTKTLKSNAEKIRSNLIKDVKDLKKQRLNRDRIQRNILERGEVREIEKNLTSTKTPTGKKVSSILKSPMGIVDKIFGFGGLLLTGIVVNAIDNIIRNWKEFKKEGIFKFFGDMIKSVRNFIDNVDFDKIAKYEDGKLTGGALKNIVDTFKAIDKMARRVATVIANGIGGSWYGASKTGEQNVFGRSPEQMGRVERFFAGFLDATLLDSTDFDKQGRIYNLFKNPEEPKTWNEIINQVKDMDINIDKLNFDDISAVDPDIIQFNQEIINNIAVPTESGNNGEVASSEISTLSPIWSGVA